MSPSPITAWIEAMRLRTLPVSVAGVITATGYALAYRTFSWIPALLCLAVAVLAQIASNFANEYYDYRDGLDRAGRIGPRRGVTEGDIQPRHMLRATFITLGLACAAGCGLICYGGWWMLAVGAAIAIGVVAYSAGPFPLSRHGLGEVAVMLFFGIIPVNLTYWLQAGAWDLWVSLASVAIGLMGANVLIVNNYRDRDDDAAVGKRTLAVIFGRGAMQAMYLTNGILALALLIPTWMQMPLSLCFIPFIWFVCHVAVWWQLCRRPLERLTPCLGMTAMLMLAYSVAFAISAAIVA